MKFLPRFIPVAALALVSLGMCQLEAQTCVAQHVVSVSEVASGPCRIPTYAGLYYYLTMSGFYYCPNANTCPTVSYMSAYATAAGVCVSGRATPPIVGTVTCPGAYCYSASYMDLTLLYVGSTPVPFPADSVLYGSPWSCTYASKTMACH